ncbi:hypothetical protein Tco_1524744 [Tanacetum coccineum]
MRRPLATPDGRDISSVFVFTLFVSWISSVPFLRPRCPRSLWRTSLHLLRRLRSDVSESETWRNFTRGAPLSKLAVVMRTAQPITDALTREPCFEGAWAVAGSVLLSLGTFVEGVVKVAAVDLSTLVIVAVVWVVQGLGPIAVRQIIWRIGALQKASLEIASRGLVALLLRLWCPPG